MGRQLQSSVVVRVPVGRAYGYWRTLENLPRFMSNVEEVSPAGEGRTHWRVKGPLGGTVEYDARTTRDEPEEVVAWSGAGGDVQTSGEVRFERLGPERTRVEVSMEYGDEPGGALGEAAATVFANPHVMLDRDLRSFKEILEGTTTPEEVQRRMADADARRSLVLLSSAAGLGLLLVSLLGLLRGGRRRG